MNNQQIMDMLGIDAKAAQLTREACEGRMVESNKGPVLCGGLGLDVKTAVYAIKCGLEAGGVERKDSGEWLVVDIGLYDFVKEMEGRWEWFSTAPVAFAEMVAGFVPRGDNEGAGMIHISYDDDYDKWLKNEPAQSSMFNDAPATKGTRGAYGGEG